MRRLGSLAAAAIGLLAATAGAVELVQGVTAAADGSWTDGTLPVNAANNLGMSDAASPHTIAYSLDPAKPTHKTGWHDGGTWMSGHWRSGPGPITGHWIIFTLPAAYEVAEFAVWNFNANEALSSGIQDFTIWTSASASGDADWVQRGGTWTLAQAPGLATYTGEGFVLSGLGGNWTGVRRVKFLPVTNYGDTGVYVGLSEVRFYGIPPAPPVPTGLAVSPGNTQVVLTWTASPGATGYSILTSNSTTQVVETNTATASPYTKTGLSNGTLYSFSVSATNSGGASAWCTPESATPDALPPVVDNASGATQITAVKAKINGTLTAYAPAHVTMYWGDTDGETNQLAVKWAHTNSLNELGAGSFFSSATGLTAGVTYYYRCHASNEFGGRWAAATTNFVARDMAGPGQTWDAGGGATRDWTCALNWTSDVMPGRPANSVVTFADAGAGATSRMDVPWVLGGGLTMNSSTGGAHTIDLQGNSLTISNGTFLCDRGVMILTNGTARIGVPSAPAGVWIEMDNDGAWSYRIEIQSDVTLNLGDVKVADGWGRGSNNGGAYSYGVFDLRQATTAQSVFSCGTLTIGYAPYPYWDNWCAGRLYLNDKNQALQTFAVSNLYFYKGELVLNPGCDVEIGSSGAPGVLWVSRSGDDSLGNPPVVFAPTGDFTAYLTNMVVGYGWTDNNGAGFCVGTLDLSNAVIKAFDVSGTVKIGDNNGVGNVYLGNGEVYFDSLQVGVNPFGFTPGTSTLDVSGGTVLTVGDEGADTFAVDPSMGRILLDFSDAATQLRVYGDYRVSGPAVAIPSYVASGRIVVTNDLKQVVRVYYNAPYTVVGMPPMPGAVLIVR